MEVGHHDPLEASLGVATDSGGPALPALLGRRVVVAGVHERPVFLALYR